MDIWIKLFVGAILLCGLISGTEGECSSIQMNIVCKSMDKRRIISFFFRQLICNIEKKKKSVTLGLSENIF